MPTVHDDAFCIRVWDWSETSQTVSLFCRAHGVVRGLAKGAKRDDSRFSGGFELLTRGQVGLILKSSDAMATLTSWDLTQLFPAVRSGLPAFYSGMAMLDLVHHLVKDGDPHPPLFDALAECTLRLGGTAESTSALARFLWAALSEAGYRPELAQDVRTSRPLAIGEPIAFDARLGGFTRWAPDATDESWRVRPKTLEVLKRLSSNGVLPGDQPDVLRASRLLYAYVRETVGVGIPSVETAMQTLSG